MYFCLIKKKLASFVQFSQTNHHLQFPNFVALFKLCRTFIENIKSEKNRNWEFKNLGQSLFSIFLFFKVMLGQDYFSVRSLDALLSEVKIIKDELFLVQKFQSWITSNFSSQRKCQSESIENWKVQWDPFTPLSYSKFE